MKIQIEIETEISLYQTEIRKLTQKIQSPRGIKVKSNGMIEKVHICKEEYENKNHPIPSKIKWKKESTGSNVK